MWEWLFSTGGYSPHGYCLAWDPALLWTHVVSDVLIAVAYFSIPAVIVAFLRQRRDPTLHGPAMLFVTFIAACGITHLLGVLTLYLPYYGIQGLSKVFTAVVSCATAVILWRLLPDALRIPSPGQLMAALNDKEREIAEREEAQAKLTRHEQALELKVTELQAANSELNQFAYAASHDLKSPANTLALWLGEFREDYAERLDDEGREALDEAESVVERMRTLVEDILIYSRIVNGTPADPVRVNLRETVESVIADQREAIRSSGATVHIDIAGAPVLSGYPTQISMLVGNLLSNSLKFRAPDRPPSVTISARQSPGEPGRVRLCFKDNGIGIAPEHHDKIFRMFTRLHTVDTYEGNGLGLALCRRIVATHGGSISVTSKPGTGTEFVITLPTELQDVARAA